jgi:hypothetical protein
MRCPGMTKATNPQLGSQDLRSTSTAGRTLREEHIILSMDADAVGVWIQRAFGVVQDNLSLLMADFLSRIGLILQRCMLIHPHLTAKWLHTICISIHEVRADVDKEVVAIRTRQFGRAQATIIVLFEFWVSFGNVTDRDLINRQVAL